jgi:hypothetical protein
MMTSHRPQEIITSWRKATASGSENCVEVALWRNAVYVRDSKDKGESILVFTPDEWDAFLTGVDAGEFGLGALAN